MQKFFREKSHIENLRLSEIFAFCWKKMVEIRRESGMGEPRFDETYTGG